MIRLQSSANFSLIYTTKSIFISQKEAKADLRGIPGGVYNIEFVSNNEIAVYSLHLMIPLTVESFKINSTIAGGALLKILGNGFSNDINRN